MKNKFLFITILLITLLAFTQIISAKSYTLDKAEVEYYIQPNGEVNVIEYITFNFNGDFTYAYRTLPTGNWSYSDFKIFDREEEIKYITSHEGSKIKHTWYYTARNEIKIFKMTYTIKNSVKAYSDVGEFYWKVWQEGWDHPLKELTGFIEFPSKVNDANQIYSWGHPEINGKIAVQDNQRLIFQAFNISQNQWIEIRTAFPSSMLSMPKITQIGLAKIIEEENNYTPQKIDSLSFEIALFSILPFVIVFLIMIIIPVIVNTVIGKVSNTLNRISQIIAIIIIIIFGLYLILTYSPNYIWIVAGLTIVEIILFVIIWHYKGREPKIDYNSEYEREIPYDYSPSIVKMLITPGSYLKTPTPTELSAEIMYLALKKVIKIQSVKVDGKEDYLIEIINNDSELTTSQIKLMSLIQKVAYLEPQTFWEKYIIKKKKEPTPKVLSIKELKIYLEQHKEEASEWFRSWQKTILKEYKTMEFDTYGGIPHFILINVVFAITSLIMNNTTLLASTIILTLIPLIIFPQSLAKRTQKGALHYTKWVNLKKFLHDFSELKKMPPTAIALWEQYLVYAVVLGEGKTVEKAMNVVFKNPRDFHSTAFIGTTGFSSRFGSISTNFSSAFNSAVASSGSSGFSGGGGGGGGGGAG